jgi:WD40 repeat protein
VIAVAFAPDGRTLATTSNDRTVILWDLTDRDQPLRLGNSLNGHIDPVIAVVFAADGDTLTTISNTGTAITK